MNELDKYYRVYAAVDLDAARENVINLMSNTAPGTKGLAVIKTDGYGMGAVPIARKIDDLVYMYAVASVNEAINLRNNKIIKPILILSYVNEYYYNDMINMDIIPAMFTEKMIRSYAEHASNMGKTARVHIAVDTGMGRIGFKDTKENAKLLAKLSKLPGIKFEGIFTHFAKADEINKSYTDIQIDRFEKFVESIKTEGYEFDIVHCSNSAGIIEIPKANKSMVRMGISLYGFYPSDEVVKDIVSLKPVLSLHSHITYVKDINPGDGVSYGATFIADKPMRVATISVGYGDGYPRNLSNKGYVLIKGKKANIIGRVCMDQFMVDVTNIKDTAEGDEVILVGKDGNETITVEELSKLAGTFNYEFLCDLGKRIPRVYYSDGKICGSKDYFNDLY